MVVFTRRDGEKAQDFVSTLQRVGPPMGMQVGKPKMVDLPTDKTDVLIDRISGNLHADSTQLVGLSCHFVIFLSLTLTHLHSSPHYRLL